MKKTKKKKQKKYNSSQCYKCLISFSFFYGYYIYWHIHMYVHTCTYIVTDATHVSVWYMSMDVYEWRCLKAKTF